jgi:zinc protease
MMVVIVGDTDPVMAEKLVRKNFAGMKARAEKRDEPALGHLDHKGEKALYFYEKESGGATVSIDVARSISPAPDTVESEKKMLRRMMAMGILQERLDAASRKKGSSFTKASSGTYTFLREIDHTSVRAGCDSKKWEQAVTDISKGIETALKFGFRKDEAERIKKRVLAGIDRDVATASTRDSKALADEIIDAMNDGTVFYSPEYQKKTFAPFIQGLTADDFSESFREMWQDDHRLIMVTGNAEIKSDSDTPEDMIISAYRKGKALASEMPEPEKEIKFPYLKIPADPGKIIRKTRDSVLGITTIEFQNGIVLHYKKTSFKADEIIMNVSFGEGRFNEPSSKPGLAFLSAPVLNDSGTGTLSAEDLQKALAGKSISLSFQTDDDKFFYQCASSKKDLRTLFDLVYSKIQDPGFRDEALDRKKKQHEQDYEGLIKSPEGLMGLKSPYFLSGNDRRFLIPEPSAIEKYSVDDIREWISPSLSGDPMEISISGDIDENEVINLASLYFGTLPARKPFGKIPCAKISFPAGKKLELSVNSQEKNAYIQIVWPVPDVKGIKDLKTIRRLNILATILENRLIKTVREKLGETYSPQAAFDIEMGYEGTAAIHAFINAESSKTDEILKTVMEISEKIFRSSGSEITDQEFDQAVRPFITALKEKLKKNIYWVNGVMAGSKQQPEKFEWSKNAMQDHQSIRKPEIAALGKKYLDNRKAAVITVKSEAAEKH